MQLWIADPQLQGQSIRNCRVHHLISSWLTRLDAQTPSASGGRWVPVAIMGVVPVKVTADHGAIRPGDLLTASCVPGHARRAEPVTVEGVEFYRPGTVLGKALQPLESGTGTITVLLTM